MYEFKVQPSDFYSVFGFDDNYTEVVAAQQKLADKHQGEFASHLKAQLK